jgi:lipopolysaccharide assembly outer membrane protein LptD (OstA)
MRKLSAIALSVFLFALISSASFAQEQPSWEVQALNQIVPGTPVGNVVYDMASGMAHGTNGVFVKYGDTVLTADSASVNSQTGDAMADGHVRIMMGGQLWVGEHINYNFKTHLMQSEQFRMGKPPVFAYGKELQGNTTNQTYTARHAFVTSDDVSDPAIKIRASKIQIVPGKYVEMWNAVLFVDGVPAFYFPYYKRNLGPHAGNLNFLAGYRSAYGPYLLNTYTWWLNNTVDGKIHFDYRERRGVGAGPDLDLHLGQWGNATLKYYYQHDQRPDYGTNGLPDFGPVPENRQRLYLGWQATPFTNLNVTALVNYQSDPFVLHDFFEDDYRDNPQPDSFVEVNKYWENWSLDAETTPRINSFFDQVERLPDVRLTGFRQQIFNTPAYYESESSAGWYRSFVTYTNGVFPGTNGFYADSAARADTYHQVLLPWTFFNWLNVTPRVGERFTYYSEQSASSGTNSEVYRTVFNTGIAASFKMSQLWAGATNSFFQVDGLRHIIEPSVNYAYVPDPSTPPTQLPQFDSQLPSLLILPVDSFDYNDIDSIDSQNVVRFGLRNTLQTKRDGQLDNLLDWNLLLDWRLNPNSQTNALNPLPQKTFNDLYSELTFKPRSWLTLESQVRYDINDGLLNMAFHQLTFSPNERWSWGLGHWYLRDNFIDSGDNLVTSTMFYRLDDNWGLRATHYFNAEDGRLQEQFYTLYRDMRSWTGALTFRVVDDGTGPEDFTIAFTFSLKVSPSRHVGDDAVMPYHLVGE